MPRLHDVLDRRKGELLDGFARSLAEGAESNTEEAAPDARLMALADELVRSLRAPDAGGARADVPEPIDEDERQLDGAVDSVALTRALGTLHRRILEMAAEGGVEVTLSVQLVIAERVNAEIARAAAGQERRNERRMRRVAHQLRNPLGSALLALSLLRSKVDLGESNRLAEMIERNLQRLQGLIDESVGESGAGAQ